MSDQPIFGVAAEFEDPTKLVEAARAVREHGYSLVEAYSPYPLKELDEILPGWNPLPLIVFVSGFLGAGTAWAMQYYIAAIDYPTNIGGRPLDSWPAFIPITFELTILFASLAAFIGCLALCGFPRPSFPLFNLRQFSQATQDRFFLCIEARDPFFDIGRTSDLLQQLGPVEVWEVENS